MLETQTVILPVSIGYHEWAELQNKGCFYTRKGKMSDDAIEWTIGQLSYRYSWKKALLVRNERKWLLSVDLGRGYWTLSPQGISFLGIGRAQTSEYLLCQIRALDIHLFMY